MAGILTRAKMAPLHLDVTILAEAFKSQLEVHILAHISHTRYLRIGGSFDAVLAGLLSSAPILESLSLLHKFPFRGHPAIIPDNLLNCTAPNLTSLELQDCDISWKSPLLKGLRNLWILDIPTPKLEDWLDAFNEMPKLEELSLQSAAPLAPETGPLMSEPLRTITLPSLTDFHIHGYARDCALALAHLLLPALTRLHVDVISHDQKGENVRLVIPYIARNVYVLQGIEPIRSIMIAGERTHTEVLTWTMPNADVEVCRPAIFNDISRSACLRFTAENDFWYYRRYDR